MLQKPVQVPRAEVYARALHENQNVKRAGGGGWARYALDEWAGRNATKYECMIYDTE